MDAKVNQPQPAVRWVIIDRHTRKQIGEPYASKARARTRADKLDNEYGGYRYTVVAEDRARASTRACNHELGPESTVRR